MRAAVIGSAMLVLGAFGFVSAGAQTGPFCYVASLPATIVGTDGADHLVGTYGADVVVAGGGNDRIVVGRGKDVVCAGSGDDRVEAGTGRDYVLAEAGRDRVNLGRRADASADYYILGGASGGPGDDRLWGAKGATACPGGPAMT
jgi:Ca2+-binding RTX toxin-like protein